MLIVRFEVEKVTVLHVTYMDIYKDYFDLSYICFRFGWNRQFGDQARWGAYVAFVCSFCRGRELQILLLNRCGCIISNNGIYNLIYSSEK